MTEVIQMNENGIGWFLVGVLSGLMLCSWLDDKEDGKDIAEIKAEKPA